MIAKVERQKVEMGEKELERNRKLYTNTSKDVKNMMRQKIGKHTNSPIL